MRIRNVNGTSDLSCSCGSWLNHWKNYSRQSVPSYCSERNCIKKPEVGAHVQKDSIIDKTWYIVPLCNEHNLKASALDIGDYVALVAANTSSTCALSRIGRY